MEFNYYIIVLIVAIIFLILLLTFIGLSFDASQNMNFPPSRSTCPDYWIADYSDPEKPTCKIDTRNVGMIQTVNNKLNMTDNPNDPDKTKAYTPGYNASTNTVDFNNTGWAGLFASSAQCSMKKWANKYDISWDGVANFNKC
jgi:hypothetical protein